MKTQTNYEQTIRNNADLILAHFRKILRLRLESSAGFSHFRELTQAMTPFAVQDALGGILDAVRVHIGPVNEAGIGQMFITYKKSKLNLLSNDLPQRVWGLTQKRSADRQPCLGFLGEIMQIGSDLDCVANVCWKSGEIKRISFVSAGYRKPESKYLQEITEDALAICLVDWSIDKGDFNK